MCALCIVYCVLCTMHGLLEAFMLLSQKNRSDRTMFLGCDVNRISFFDLRLFLFPKSGFVYTTARKLKCDKIRPNTSVGELCGRHKDEGMLLKFHNDVVTTSIAVADFNQSG